VIAPRSHGTWVIVATFAVAFMLTAVPLPEVLRDWRPAWVTLVLVYWGLALPERVGVAAGWFAGLLLDAMLGTLLGQHALALSLVAFFAVKLHLRLRVIPLWQQGLSILVLVLLERGLALWVNGILGMPGQWTQALGPALVSAVLWPWVFIVLRDLRRRFRVV
jgi:rod shape-determining protein MreD